MRTAAFFAYKDVSKDKRTGLLITAVLAFSFVNLIFFSSFMGGLENTFYDQIVNTVTSHITINPKENMSYIEGISNLEQKLNLLPGVVGVSPHISDSGTLRYKNEILSVPIVALIPSKDIDVTLLSQKVVAGDFLGDNDLDEILLGSDLIASKDSKITDEGKQKLDIKVGDRVSITFSNGIIRNYRVKGIINTKFMGPDKSVFITNKEIESVLGIKDKASQVLIRIPSKDNVDSMRLLLLQQGINGEIKTWKDNAGFVEAITSSMSALTVITSFVGILTASLTIAIIIYITTNHKKRQIGILKAIGSKNKTILEIFLLEAAIFAISGISIGLIISYLLSSYIQTHPLPLPIGDVVLIITPTLVAQSAFAIFSASIAAGFYPAWKASRQNIVKSVWG